MDKLEPPYNTIVEALLEVEECTEFGARFIPKSGDPVFYSFKEVLSRAKSAAGSLQAKGLVPGDRVAIILSTSIHFLDAFLGVQLAGGIPTALYPPFRLGRLDEYHNSTSKMLTTIGARFLLTDGRIGKLLGPVVEGARCVEGVLNPRNLQSTAPWTPVTVNPESPAFLQFSSGSTREPKAVIVSHTNLLYNLEMMNTFFSTLSPEQWNKEAVCWLPLYHDMGLVGCVFNSLYIPCTMSYIEPDVFLARPAIWLQTLSRFRAGISPAPQFAYNLCVNKIKDEDMAGVDLSDWVSAMNGAEPIDIQGMGKFMERFARWGFRESAMMPVYGLAEAALGVTFSDVRCPPLVSAFDRSELNGEVHVREGAGRDIASVGSPLPGVELRICDEQDNPIKDGLIGKIMIKGPSITPGYYNEPEITETTIRNGWLDTGDLGFIHDGNLYITGRTKDLIIIRGRNIDPQEIEVLLNDMEGIRKGCVAALSTPIEGLGEQLVILAERNIRQPIPEEKLVKGIRERVIAGISVAPYHVQILQPGTLPRTSSGKKRRSEALRLFLSGELVPPEKMGVFKLLHKIGKSQVAWGRYFLKQRTSK